VFLGKIFPGIMGIIIRGEPPKSPSLKGLSGGGLVVECSPSC